MKPLNKLGSGVKINARGDQNLMKAPHGQILLTGMMTFDIHILLDGRSWLLK